MQIQFDPSEMRKQAGLSQANMARLLGVKQSQVSRWEKSPGKVPWEVAILIRQICGEIVTSRGLRPDAAAYKSLQDDLNRLEQSLDVFARQKTDGEQPQDDQDNSVISKALRYPRDFLDNLRHLSRKPRIGISGRFDQGKSRLANTLLGGDRLPTSYRPATGLICLVRHVSERPEWMAERDVCLVRRKIKKRRFDFNRAGDAEYLEKYHAASGGFDLLQDYATRTGRHHLVAKEQDLFAAIVFIDAPILECADLVDFPGYAHDDDDDQKAEFAHGLVDILVYVSGYNTFMDAHDLVYITGLLKQLPNVEIGNGAVSLRNAYFVATRASHYDGDSIKRDILHKAAEEDAYPHLDHILDDISLETFKGRFFPFDAEHANHREDFESDLSELLGHYYPNFLRRRLDEAIEKGKKNADEQLGRSVGFLEDVLKNNASRAAELDEMKRRAPDREKERRAKADHIIGVIGSFKEETRTFVKDKLKRKCTLEAIKKMIERRYKDRKAAISEAASYLINDLQHDLDEFVTGKSKNLAKEIDGLGDLYAQRNVSLSAAIPFDFQGAFIGGLAGATAYGALSVWAATVAAGSNLGGYILIAKVVSALSAMGISVGGTAAAASAIAAIGGPVTVMIGLAGIAALLAWTLFGSTWQERLARKIHMELKAQGVLGTLADYADEFWDDTETAFNKGFKATEEAYNEYMQGLRNDIRKAGRPEALDIRRKELVFLQETFRRLPWPKQGGK